MLYLDNPQVCSLFGHTALERLAGSKLNSKWPFLLQLVRERKAGIYDSGKRTLHLPTHGKWKKIQPYVYRLEFLFWLLVHRINPLRVTVVHDLKKLGKDDFLFSFLHGRVDQTQLPDSADYANCAATKIAHVSHFNFYPEALNRGFASARIDVLMGEADLNANSPFFRDCFPNQKARFMTLPYGFAPRFVRKNSWEQRVPKCAVTGTFQRVSQEKDGCGKFIEFFRTDTLHTLRRTIYENREKLASDFEIMLSNLDAEVERVAPRTDHSEGNNKISKVLIFLKRFYEDNLVPHHGRRKYYDFDIVDFYNRHRLFVVPEEVVGLPAIGFVEGMACGAAYIGQDHAMYRDVGLIPGKHYVGYDGSLEDLQAKVRYYLSHDAELRAIAEAGYAFVQANFTAKKIKERFFASLTRR